MEEAFFGAGIDGIGGDADAGCELDAQAGFVQPDRLADELVEAAGDIQGVFL